MHDTKVSMFSSCQNYRYLDLLNVLCVCDGVAIQNNQTYITEHWLRRDRVRSAVKFLIREMFAASGDATVDDFEQNEVDSPVG